MDAVRGSGRSFSGLTRFRPRRPTLYLLLSVAAAAVAFFGFDSIYGFTNSSAASSSTQRTATVTRGIVQSSVSASGNVGVASSASAAFGTSGTLTAVEVQVGAHVKAGQVLAKIDPSSAQTTLQSAEASLAGAESTLAAAQSGLTAAQQAANASSLQQAQQTVVTDQQQLAADQTTLTTAKAQQLADQRLGCPATSSAGSSGSSAASSSGANGSSGSGSSLSGGSAATGSSANGSAANGSSANGSTTSGSATTGSGGSGASSAGGSSTTGSSSAGSAGAASASSTTGVRNGLAVVSSAAATPTSSTTPSSTTPSSTTPTSTTPGSSGTGSSGSAGSGSTGSAGTTTAGGTTGTAAAATATSSASTGQASAVGTTTATLSGSVDPAGLKTTYWFAYGSSAVNLSSKTAKFDAGSGTGAVPVSVPVSGLKPLRSYTFQLIASNSAGTTEGALGLFTTGAPQSAATGQASSVASTAATFSGEVTPAGLATRYWFQYGTSAGKLSHATAKLEAGSGSGSVPVSVSVRGLKVNQSYLFRLVASNSSGISYGALGLFTTSGTTQSASTGTASSVGSTTASLSGTVSPSGLETSYWFRYGTSSSSLPSATGKLSAGSGTGQVSATAAVAGLEPGRTYFFRLVASNASGTSDGAEASFVTSAAAVPTVVTGSASTALTSIVTLNGSVNPNGSDTKYWFEYGTTSAYGSRTALLDAGSGTSATEVTATVSGLKSNTSYLFRVVAANSFGTSAGIGTVVKTAESACVSDAAAITADEQTLARQQSTDSSAVESLAQTEATITASETPSAPTIMQDKATVAQDEATVVADQKALAETTLTAPIAGVVTAVSGSVGGTVSASGSTVSKGAASAASSSTASSGAAGSGGTGAGASSSSSSAFATFDSLGQLEIVSGFAEADATKIALGQPATITFPALPNTEVAGRVVAVSNTSTVVSNVVTYNETIALINPPSEVKDGMTAQVSVVDQTANHVLQLPTSAITTTGTVSTVELLQNGKTTVTVVKTGLVGNSSTQIVSGLKLGDVVVEPTVTITAASSSSTSTGLGTGGFGGGGFGGGGGGGGVFTRGG